ncbi:MAG: XdhC family protein [Oliverpabstia sp.]|nr:XdhC family protein [Lachnospiraceae bacterium]MDY5027234.1 XdhC family protein [Oliverpabstia sp.]
MASIVSAHTRITLIKLKIDTPNKKVLATIVTRKGSAPKEVSTKILILRGGRTIGTIGEGCLEAEVFQKSLRLMEEDSHRPFHYCADMTGKMRKMRVWSVEE